MPDARSPRVWLAVAWSVFQLYTAYAGMYDLLIQLPVHVAFAVALGFLTAPIADSPEAAARLARRRPRRWLDGALAALALLCAAHYVWHNERLASRMAMVDAPLPVDAAVGVLFVALLLGAAWRHIGPALVVMALAFIVYVFVGPRLPGFLSHGGESALNLIDQQMFTTGGVFGIPTLVAAPFIFLFVVFGSVMSYGGLLRFFTDAALAVAGHTQGGAGKVAVISSGLFGTVNGSAIANAVTTGAFTIPLMKRAGYRPAFAAGVEACASMGGQLIPPVMGAAAFIMAETLQMPYSSIAIAAAIPGVLYFVAVGVMVHFEAARQGLPVLPRHELPRLAAVLRRDFHLLGGPAVLVWFLVQGRSPMFAGFWALVVAFALSWLRRETRIDARRIFAILADSAQAAMAVALACATVGHAVGPVGLRDPVQFRLRPGATADRRLGAAHRVADGGGHARHRDARRRSHRLLSGAHAAVGARAAAGGRAAADPARRVERPGGSGVLRDRRRVPARGRAPCRARGRVRAELAGLSRATVVTAIGGGTR